MWLMTEGLRLAAGAALREVLANPTMTGWLVALLAMFHTVISVLGVLMIWPLSNRLVAFLETHFRSAEEDEGPTDDIDRQANAWEANYQSLKATVLKAGAMGTLAPSAIEVLLRSNSALRRSLQQALKASRVLRSPDGAT